MYCPRCGQERTSEATSFCSRCGFLLTVTSELLPTGGSLPPTLSQNVPAGPSPRSRGIRRGILMFLLMFVVAPVIGLLCMMVGLRPWPVGIAVFLLGVGGLLRMVYALMFESNYPIASPTGAALRVADAQLTGPAQASLPPHQTIPASEYAAPQHGRWRDTNDLEPASVTDNTTKLLEKESEPPA